jgi:tetratricopeptide (TPR) repeat protein
MISLGEQYLRMKRYEKAYSIFTEAKDYAQNKDISDDMDGRRILIADLLVQEKKYQEADRTMDMNYMVIHDESRKDELFNKQMNLGEILINEKEFNEAEKLYNKLDVRAVTENQKSVLYRNKLFLGDLYSQEKEFGSAADIYNDLIDNTGDTTLIRIAKERISWLPQDSFNRGFSSLGSAIGILLPKNPRLLPVSEYYSDNHKFRLLRYGLQFTAGFTGLISLGAAWLNTSLWNSMSDRNFNQYKIKGVINLSEGISIDGNYGILKSEGEKDKRIGDITLTFVRPERFNLSLSYENTDSRLILYSPFLIHSRMKADYFHTNVSYNYTDLLRLSSSYHYMKLADGNKGNDFQIQFGK